MGILKGKKDKRKGLGLGLADHKHGTPKKVAAEPERAPRPDERPSISEQPKQG